MTHMIRHLITALLMPFLLFSGAVMADELSASDQAGLLAALRGAEGGDMIRLAPGNYGILDIDSRKPGMDFGFSSTGTQTITVISADSANPAVFDGLSLRGTSNLVLQNLVFDYTFAPGQKIYKRPFEITYCHNVTVRDSLFDGDVARGVSAEADGLGYAFGLVINNCQGVTVSGNLIRDFFRGMVLAGNSDVAVTGNELTRLRMDGMNFVQNEDILIEGNFIHDFSRSIAKGDHADMIQFWTNRTKKPSRGITIRGNLLLAGNGQETQSIFMRNDLVDRGIAGREMFYRDVTIEDNVIMNGHLHGITLGESDGVRIRNNTLLRDPDFAKGERREKKIFVPRINLKESSTDVVIENNVAAAVPAAQPGWRVGNNLLVQDLGRMAGPGFYDFNFEPRPKGGKGMAGQIPLRVVPGGDADRPDLGAPMMR